MRPGGPRKAWYAHEKKKQNSELQSRILHFFLVRIGTVFVAGSADRQDKVYLFDVDAGVVTQETT